MYEFLKEAIKPELVVLVPVLYLIGMALKRSQLPDKFIPLILGGAGILLSGIWVLATTQLGSWQEILLSVFTAVTQGILVAGASVYVNQVIKQAGKDE